MNGKYNETYSEATTQITKGSSIILIELHNETLFFAENYFLQEDEIRMASPREPTMGASRFLAILAASFPKSVIGTHEKIKTRSPDLDLHQSR